MTYAQNVESIIRTHFSGFQDEIIDSAVESILKLQYKPEVKKGAWIHEPKLSNDDFSLYTCNRCGTIVGNNTLRYCFNCGAKMRKE